jgi:pimeloyl-ACP methyl ester carboxylesterase
VLVFDYRGFGTSDGETRQDIDHVRHRQDYHAAIAAARARKGVDPSRIAIWGSSYSGGHVIVVAAQDPTVRAVISQGAAMDGLAALAMLRRESGTAKMLSLTSAGLRDGGRTLTRRAPLLVPVVGEPGSAAAITAPGADAGYRAIMGPTFRNEMRARGILRIARNRPIRFAKRVGCPVFIVVAEEDNVVPVSAVHAVAAALGDRAEVLSFPCGHFDIYVDDVFEKSATEQTEFLRRTLS